MLRSFPQSSAILCGLFVLTLPLACLGFGAAVGAADGAACVLQQVESHLLEDSTLTGDAALAKLGLEVSPSDLSEQSAFLRLISAELFGGEYGAKSFRKYLKLRAKLTSTGSFPHGLSEIEFLALRWYMGGGYVKLNLELRGLSPESKGKYQPFAHQLDTALKKLPDFDGHVTRRTDLPPALAESHRVGASVRYQGFTSTTTYESGMANGGPYLLKIHSRHGKYVGDLAVGDEREVLFRPDSAFQVIDVRPSDFGGKVIVLDEIP